MRLNAPFGRAFRVAAAAAVALLRWYSGRAACDPEKKGIPSSSGALLNTTPKQGSGAAPSLLTGERPLAARACEGDTALSLSTLAPPAVARAWLSLVAPVPAGKGG